MLVPSSLINFKSFIFLADLFMFLIESVSEIINTLAKLFFSKETIKFFLSF